MAVYLGVFIILLAALSLFIGSVYSIDCYQCSGTDSRQPFECNEFLDSTSNLEAANCTSIYGAKYCIKHVGRYEGGISTKRYCSSLDLGNYCNYVQQPGDKLSYRTCVYTCSTDGCNSAPINGLTLGAITLLVLVYLI